MVTIIDKYIYFALLRVMWHKKIILKFKLYNYKK